jgi:hypothetical protein
LRERLACQEAGGCAFVLVLGASGSGKSSLVKAGLLPDLMLPGMIGRVSLVRHAVFRPSDRPDDLLGGLASAIGAATALPELVNLRYTPKRFAELLRDAPKTAIVPIEHVLAEAAKAQNLSELAEARLILIIDQLEELFTLNELDTADCDSFVEAMGTLARSGVVWVVATMRSDFYDRLQLAPSLSRLASDESRYSLVPPDTAELGQIIRLPAREAGQWRVSRSSCSLFRLSICH